MKKKITLAKFEKSKADKAMDKKYGEDTKKDKAMDKKAVAKLNKKGGKK